MYVTKLNGVIKEAQLHGATCIFTQETIIYIAPLFSLPYQVNCVCLQMSSMASLYMVSVRWGKSAKSWGSYSSVRKSKERKLRATLRLSETLLSVRKQKKVCEDVIDTLRSLFSPNTPGRKETLPKTGSVSIFTAPRSHDDNNHH